MEDNRVKKEVISYWKDSWEAACRGYQNSQYEFLLVNPHILINEIIDEINSNQMQNKDNKAYLIKQLKIHSAKDHVIKSNYSNEFSILISSIEEQNLDYTLILCENILNFFKSGKYRDEIFAKLLKVLFSEKELDIVCEDIKYINQSLIVELFLKGNSIETVSKIPNKLLAGFIELPEGSWITEFPHGIEHEDFSDLEVYKQAVMKKMKSLTLKDRISRLSFYLSYKQKKFQILFPIKGVVVEDYTIGDVIIYNPKIKTMLHNNTQVEFEKDELFERENMELIQNIAVWVTAVDFEVAKEIAIKKAVKVFDILRLFTSAEASLTVMLNKHLILDNEGRILQTSSSIDPDNHPMQWAFSVNLETQNEFKNTIENTKDWWTNDNVDLKTIEQRFIYSTHWFRKAVESKIDEDKLLNFWIVIENCMDFKENHHNLFLAAKEKETPYTLAKEIIGNLEALRIKNDLAIKLYYRVKHLQENYFWDDSPLMKKLPKKLLKKLGIKPSKMRIYDFIDHIDLIDDYLLSSFFKDEILEIKNVYIKNDKALKTIKERIGYVQDDIQHIYRLRNKIVHNAHYDNRLLRFYTKRAEYYSRILLIQIIEEYKKDNSTDLKKIFVDWHLKKTIFFKKLDANKISDLLRYEY